MAEQLSTEKEAPDVIVIGAGIIGITTAIELLLMGAKVTVLDREGVAAGASRGNAGAFAFSDAAPVASPGIMKKAPKWLFDPLGPLSVPLPYALKIAPWMYRFWRASRPDQVRAGTAALVALMTASRERLVPLMETTGTHNMLRQHGNLQLYESRKAFEENLPMWREREARGVKFTALTSPEEIAEHQPGIDRRFVGAIHTNDWYGISDPKDYTTALSTFFESRGGTIRIAEASALEAVSGGVSVVLSDGTRLSADQIVVAAGAWSHRLAKTLGDHIPLETERGYNTTLPVGAFDLKRQLSFEEHGFVVSPLSSGIRVGGAVELGGLNLPPNYRRADALLKKAKSFLPGLKTEGGTQWMGFRPSLPDSIPVIGPASATNRIIYAFGHGHLGLTQSAGTARIVANLVMGRENTVDLAPYRPQRF
ncbi:FAD-dependent oxidoreductase [uncultured Sneathiella sp.]|jgi:D-amino-acid dehydrogenase|uniref:NAD(P)/FAD-dependent oxidoreductase n=1 Tax=uncultured Sneathiella sp. TaxID=879315 RepID=UPI0030D6E6A0|tara:strand:+ start:840 stop:2108 length:1269 start_codon:yes stop_codon:yes gene_type:complete